MSLMDKIRPKLRRHAWWIREARYALERRKFFHELKANRWKPSERPCVLLLSADSMGARHLSCYGYKRQTSPTLDRLAQSGVLFERVIAQTNWTKPSLASLLTSLQPSVHRTDARGDTGDEIYLESRTQANVLEARFSTIAHAFHEAGYATAAFSNGGYAHSFFGFGRGFDVYDNHAGGAKSCLYRMLRWMLTHPGTPCFAFIHCWDTHFPYLDRPPYNHLFVSRRAKIELNSATRTQINRGERPLTGEELEFLRGLFDGGIRYFDDQLSLFLKDIGRIGLADNLLLAVTADHGEGFMEHGVVEHTECLYNEVLRVPLVLRGPGIPAGKRIAAQVRSIDIMPTLLDCCGAKPQAEVQGVSLLPWIHGEKSADLVAVAETERGGGQKALCDSQYKIIRKEGQNRTEIYNLLTDPQETRDLTSSERGLRVIMEAQLAAWEREANDCARRYWPEDAAPESADMTPEVMERLRDLGYIE